LQIGSQGGAQHAFVPLQCVICRAMPKTFPGDRIGMGFYHAVFLSANTRVRMLYGCVLRGKTERRK
jgi:hypothetical protein